MTMHQITVAHEASIRRIEPVEFAAKAEQADEGEGVFVVHADGEREFLVGARLLASGEKTVELPDDVEFVA